ncbi:peptidyl-prolyl cis-trans isomerase [Striga asiatica]|uniref:Peptidyl-prolyl cis-trans isomerase n=1 Tax=Striga asiatica TaxID=4170 RepID=A0A5A7QJR0_STRAF|nr:peptidyl-prolyl cis-trans isomerase [Striga asiatica]
MELFADVVTKTDENFCALCTDEKDSANLARMGPKIGMAGPGTNDTHFFICTTRKKWLDDKHVVFGQVVEEYDMLKAVENVGSGSHRTSRRVVIADCNQLQI